MCDTMVAAGNATADGVTIFGKNSDREPNEGHHLLRVPRASHPAGSRVKCTYIEIPQVEATHAVLLAKPYWMWGAEMGANEHGVVIGNEAVFTKVPYEKGPGLIGMDFIRLALERADTAYTALLTITGLLEKYGQGGSCGHTHDFFYHNSFIIADPADAWVLETAGHHWAAEQVKGVRTISNGITIGGEWDLASDDLLRYAVDRGWCKGRDDFHFARCYSDFINTAFGECKVRQALTTGSLQKAGGGITPETVMKALRSHRSRDGAERDPARGIFGLQVCMHAGWGPARESNTTGSMVSNLDKESPVHFLTGTSAPCTSVFKPLWIDHELPDTGPQPGGTFDAESLFWRHEVLHRETLKDYDARIALYAEDRDQLEGEFVDSAMSLWGAPLAERESYARACFARAAEAEAEWLSRVRAAGEASNQGPLYRLAWKKWDAAAGMAGQKQAFHA